ncbi:MAG: hypothetical protein QM723_37700 [Myxococcaceae bacterium]
MIMPEPTPLPTPSSLRTLGLVGLATAGVLVVKWWKRWSQPSAPEPRRTVAKVIDSRPVIDARVAVNRCAARDLPWVDLP